MKPIIKLQKDKTSDVIWTDSNSSSFKIFGENYKKKKYVKQ